MQKGSHDFNEEMHAILYEYYDFPDKREVRKLERDPNYMSIYSARATDEHQGDDGMLPACFAMYPSVGSRCKL
jgi:hypothetical protein